MGKTDSFYDRLLQKPPAYRRKLAYLITAVMGVIIFAVWLTLITHTMKKGVPLNSGESPLDLLKPPPPPSLKDQFSPQE